MKLTGQKEAVLVAPPEPGGHPASQASSAVPEDPVPVVHQVPFVGSLSGLGGAVREFGLVRGFELVRGSAPGRVREGVRNCSGWFALVRERAIRASLSPPQSYDGAQDEDGERLARYRQFARQWSAEARRRSPLRGLPRSTGLAQCRRPSSIPAREDARPPARHCCGESWSRRALAARLECWTSCETYH